jgi:hypothetical protein
MGVFTTRFIFSDGRADSRVEPSEWHSQNCIIQAIVLFSAAEKHEVYFEVWPSQFT